MGRTRETIGRVGMILTIAGIGSFAKDSLPPVVKNSCEQVGIGHVYDAAKCIPGDDSGCQRDCVRFEENYSYSFQGGCFDFWEGAGNEWCSPTGDCLRTYYRCVCGDIPIECIENLETS